MGIGRERVLVGVLGKAQHSVNLTLWRRPTTCARYACLPSYSTVKACAVLKRGCS